MLGIWMYQWSPAAWVVAAPAPSPAPAPVPSSGGSGGSRKKRQREYTPADEAFWQIRERYLRRFLHESIAEPSPISIPNLPDEELVDTLAAPPAGGEHDILLLRALHAAQQRAATANNAAELRDAVMRSRKLLLDISKIRQQHYNRAIALLLFDPL